MYFLRRLLLITVLVGTGVLAAQDEDQALKAKFTPLAEKLSANEAVIIQDLEDAQGDPVDIGGYYHTDPAKMTAAMRPSATFNESLEAV